LNLSADIIRWVEQQAENDGMTPAELIEDLFQEAMMNHGKRNVTTVLLDAGLISKPEDLGDAVNRFLDRSTSADIGWGSAPAGAKRQSVRSAIRKATHDQG
jgi:hypothetical protein